jgi:hypothetical protein
VEVTVGKNFIMEGGTKVRGEERDKGKGKLIFKFTIQFSI